MKANQKFLVMKYGTKIMEGCIKKHIEVLDNYGYCWFGKIGTTPSNDFMKEVMAAAKPIMILFGREGVYECVLEQYSFEKPHDGYPEYYDKILFADEDTIPSAYYKIIRIKEIRKEQLNKYVTVKNGKNLLETVSRSMAPFFRGVVPSK